MSGGGSSSEFQTVDMQKEEEEKNPGGDHSGRGSSPETQPRTPPAFASKSILYPRPYADPCNARRYFVTRSGAFDQAMDDLKTHVVESMGEFAHSFWLLTEIDHWNNEKERVMVITDSALLVCKYDFIMLKCIELKKVPLSCIERVCLGPFTFPERSLDRREGEGLRIFWDKVQEPTFLSRWNPWATDVPYATFTEHPVKSSSQRFGAICQMSTFSTQLVQAIQNVQRNDPASSSRTGGVVVVNEPILIDTYTGLMSFIGNRNKLGYSLARGSVGF
ncbi:tumor protein p63-regulated gene 1 protein isoform X2 [Hemicordylus capensis]|nr:tumor protein p63-regulated gene 1 protein isoform X2 [Hemicordylus capensis]